MSSSFPPGPPQGPPPGPPSGPPGSYGAPQAGPPSGPPSGPPGGPEYLSYGSGQPLPPQPPPTGRKRRGLVIGGGAVAIAAVAVGGAMAWNWYTDSGPQAAEMLPDSTLAYVSINLDPSGKQLLEIRDTLQKFPAWEKFAEEHDINSGGDLRKELFNAALREAPCDLSYDDDIDSWLGDRAAVAAIKNGGDGVGPVFVVEVDDEKAAEDAFEKFKGCDSDPDDGAALAIADGWAVFGESDAIVEDFAKEAAESPLSEDEDHRAWMDALGEPGIVTMYAAPAAGTELLDSFAHLAAPAMPSGLVAESASFAQGETPGDLADTGDLSDLGLTDEQLEQLGIDPEDLASSEPTVPGWGEDTDSPDSLTDDPEMPGMDEDGFDFDDDFGSDNGFGGPSSGGLSDGFGLGSGSLPEEFRTALKEFQGIAGVIRFADGALEMHVVSKPDGETSVEGDQGGTVIATLPEDTALALGIGFNEGWFAEILDAVGKASGQAGQLDQALSELEAQLGLSLPEDIEALLGESAAVAVGADLDPESLANSSDLSGLSAGIKIKGDSDRITSVLDKLLGSAPPEAATVFGHDSDGDMVAISPSDDYRAELLADGGLGDSEVFRNAVPQAEDASVALFVNFDAVRDMVGSAMGDDPTVNENLEPLAALGLSGWTEDGIAHGVFRLTTD